MSTDSLITDAIVDKAARALKCPSWRIDPERRAELRAALEAVEGDIIEEFGASGEPPRWGRSGGS